MINKEELQSLIAKANLWAKANGDTLDVDLLKKEAILNFQNRLLDEIRSEFEPSRTEAQKTLTAFRDLFILQYKRETFLEKIMRSKANPVIQLVKEPLFVFDELCLRDENFLNRFTSSLKDKIMRYIWAVKRKRVERRDNIPKVEGQEFDDEGDYLPDKLALVHVTNYKPKKDENGCYYLDTLATTTDLDFPRNTLHFTINHHVVSHMEGNWDKKPYVVIAPMVETMEQNGKPLGISSVDTFFEFGVNEKMVLPESTHLVEPAGSKKLPSGMLYVTHGNRTIYKSQGFTEEEREQLTERYYRDSLKEKKELTDEDLASVIKKDAVRAYLNKKGYVYAEFQRIDTPTAKKVANMGKKMGVRSFDGATLHAAVALSGVHNLGETIYDVVRMISIYEKVLDAEKIEKKGDSFLADGKEVIYAGNVEYIQRDFEKKSNLYDVFDEKRIRDMRQENLDHYKKEGEQSDYIKQEEDKIRQFDEIEKQDLPFREKFFKEYELMSGKTFSDKEKDVFMAWLEKSQKRIDKIIEKMNGRTLEQVIQEKIANQTSLPSVVVGMHAGR